MKMIKQQLKLIGNKIKTFFIKEKEPFNFFDAQEAYLTTDIYNNQYVLRIINKGIIPAKKSGKYNCKVDFFNDVPEYIIDLFESKGYSIKKSLHYGEGISIIYLHVSWER